MTNWEELVEELERATERLRAVPRGDLRAMPEAMNQRSVAVSRLLAHAREARGPAPEKIVERIRKDHESGVATREKLLLMRAEAHSEISRAAESSYLMRALQRKPQPKSRRVDCKV